MDTLAEALVVLITALDTCERDSPDVNHADLRMLEDVASVLQRATDPELQALAAAADRASAAELASEFGSRQSAQAYASFMENVFGPDWRGNKRSPTTERGNA